jgi:hypothetical protein
VRIPAGKVVLFDIDSPALQSLGIDGGGLWSLRPWI